MLTIAHSSKAEIPEDCHDVGALRGGGSLRAPLLQVFSWIKYPSYEYFNRRSHF
jgi:hypothetical protein